MGGFRPVGSNPTRSAIGMCSPRLLTPRGRGCFVADFAHSAGGRVLEEVKKLCNGGNDVENQRCDDAEKRPT